MAQYRSWREHRGVRTSSWKIDIICFRRAPEFPFKALCWTILLDQQRSPAPCSSFGLWFWLSVRVISFQKWIWNRIHQSCLMSQPGQSSISPVTVRRTDLSSDEQEVEFTNKAECGESVMLMVEWNYSSEIVWWNPVIRGPGRAPISRGCRNETVLLHKYHCTFDSRKLLPEA